LCLAGCSSTSQQTGDAKKVEETLKNNREATIRQQHNHGVIYANGEGVKQDFKEAVKWFHKAAQQGVLGSHIKAVSECRKT